MVAHLWGDSTQRRVGTTLSILVLMVAEAEEDSVADIVGVMEVVTLAMEAITKTSLLFPDHRRLLGSLHLPELLASGWGSRRLHRGTKVEEAVGVRRPQDTMEVIREALLRLPITMGAAVTIIETSDDIVKRA